jgi:uncharacterized protein (TIGR02246 family)
VGRHDIEVREKAWLAAFNAGDAEGVAECYTESARLMPPNSAILEGPDAIEPFIKGFVQTGAKLAFDLITVYDGGSVCTAVGRFTLDTPGAPQDHGKYIEVWVREGDGVWRIAEDIFNSSNPPAP